MSFSRVKNSEFGFPTSKSNAALDLRMCAKITLILVHYNESRNYSEHEKEGL